MFALKRTPGGGSVLAARAQRGLSLVELMVGVAVGLLVVAGSATMVAAQLSDSRRLVVETQIQQDLRASADIIVREIRRAGYWSDGATAPGAVWSPGSTVSANPYDEVTLPLPSEIGIAWSGANALGFRRVAGPPGVLQMKDGAGNWQALTDTAVLDVTSFQIAPVTIAAAQMACTALCAGGGQSCWPTVEVRQLRISITGKSVADHNVVRSVVSSVRLRNDRIVNNNAPGPLCPT